MKKIKGITDCKITYKAETIGTEKDWEEIDLEELKEKMIKELIIDLGSDDEEVVDCAEKLLDMFFDKEYIAQYLYKNKYIR